MSDEELAKVEARLNSEDVPDEDWWATTTTRLLQEVRRLKANVKILCDESDKFGDRVRDETFRMRDRTHSVRTVSL